MLCSPDATIRANAVRVLLTLTDEQATEAIDILFQSLEESINCPQADRSIIQYGFLLVLSLIFQGYSDCTQNVRP